MSRIISGSCAAALLNDICKLIDAAFGTYNAIAIRLTPKVLSSLQAWIKWGNQTVAAKRKASQEPFLLSDCDECLVVRSFHGYRNLTQHHVYFIAVLLESLKFYGSAKIEVYGDSKSCVVA